MPWYPPHSSKLLCLYSIQIRIAKPWLFITMWLLWKALILSSHFYKQKKLIPIAYRSSQIWPPNTAQTGLVLFQILALMKQISFKIWNLNGNSRIWSSVLEIRVNKYDCSSLTISATTAGLVTSQFLSLSLPLILVWQVFKLLR